MHRTVENGLDGLRQKKLAVMIMSAGSRVAKFRHELLNHFDLSPREVALLCVLLLRGPQTLGELRSRTERMQFFDSLEQIESFLAELARGEPPLVRVLPARPGQKESRYVQLLSGEPVMPETAAVRSDRFASGGGGSAIDSFETGDHGKTAGGTQGGVARSARGASFLSQAI